jgi:hypothetical protein
MSSLANLTPDIGHVRRFILQEIANENETGEGMKGNGDRTILLQSDQGALDSRRLKDRNVDSSSSGHSSTRSKVTDVNDFGVVDSDANSIINSELAVRQI